MCDDPEDTDDDSHTTTRKIEPRGSNPVIPNLATVVLSGLFDSWQHQPMVRSMANARGILQRPRPVVLLAYWARTKTRADAIPVLKWARHAQRPLRFKRVFMDCVGGMRVMFFYASTFEEIERDNGRLKKKSEFIMKSYNLRVRRDHKEYNGLFALTHCLSLPISYITLSKQ